MKMSLTRILSELKMLKKKIDQDIDMQYVGIYQNRSKRIINTDLNKEDFEKNKKAKFQSITDHIKKYEKLRTLLIKANSENTVIINNQERTISEWLVYKEHILPVKKTLLYNLRKQYTDHIEAIDHKEIEIQEKVEAMLKMNLGTDKKTNKEEYKNIADPFIEANRFNLMDPINISNQIEELTNEIDNITNEIDISLSEVNSKIEIDI